MSFEIKEMTVKSTDNIHTLVGRIYIPEGEPKGLLQVVHGMTEHIERYDGIMSYAAQNGYVAFGFDNLGHGKTAKDNSELGFIAHKDGWKYLVNDVNTFAVAVKQSYPDKDCILFGHSMGSFIARIAAESFVDGYQKLIICGSGDKNLFADAGLMLTDIIRLFYGEKHISKAVHKMAFGSYNKGFEGNSSREWLTKDSAVIAKYDSDKFCNYDFTVSAMHDLITLNKMSNRKEWFAKIRKDMPIFVISGACDPVGNYGKGVENFYNKLITAGCNAKLKLYENCRHEILNDTCREEVLFDIMHFINN